MRFLDLCEKEVVSVEEGRFIGPVISISLVAEPFGALS